MALYLPHSILPLKLGKEIKVLCARECVSVPKYPWTIFQEAMTFICHCHLQSFLLVNNT